MEESKSNLVRLKTKEEIEKDRIKYTKSQVHDGLIHILNEISNEDINAYFLVKITSNGDLCSYRGHIDGIHRSALIGEIQRGFHIMLHEMKHNSFDDEE